MKHDIRKKVVCIGGGTGTFVVLRGLKHYPFALSAIVTMSDSGGSNQRLRDEFGLLPTSDIRQCLVALSDENGGIGLLRKLFMYRFHKGKGISGMTFGNLFMAALSDIAGSQEKAIEQTSKVLRIRGTVIPVTLSETNLFAQYENGHTVSEEHFIDEPTHDGTLKITHVFLKPAAKANPKALQAISEADAIILGPGDLYTSLVPNLLVSGVKQALGKSRAKIIYIMNLMTKYGQTYDFKASDHIRVLEEFVGNVLSCVLVSSTNLSQKALSVYATSHEYPVKDDLTAKHSVKVIRADIASRFMTHTIKGDTLVRSLIRHDSTKLAKTLSSIILDC